MLGKRRVLGSNVCILFIAPSYSHSHSTVRLYIVHVCMGTTSMFPRVFVLGGQEEGGQESGPGARAHYDHEIYRDRADTMHVSPLGRRLCKVGGRAGTPCGRGISSYAKGEQGLTLTRNF